MVISFAFSRNVLCPSNIFSRLLYCRMYGLIGYIISPFSINRLRFSRIQDPLTHLIWHQGWRALECLRLFHGYLVHNLITLASLKLFTEKSEADRKLETVARELPSIINDVFDLYWSLFKELDYKFLNWSTHFRTCLESSWISSTPPMPAPWPAFNKPIHRNQTSHMP